MSSYRQALPQLNNQIFLTDGGMETTLIFEKGYELPYFASFDLLNQSAGYESLKDYYETYAKLAVQNHCGFILESATWRANRDWAQLLGYNTQQLAEVNQKSITLLEGIREEYALEQCPMVISGCLGPRGDGYKADKQMSANEAAVYHREQIETFATSNADMISAYTLTYPQEAIGITLAAKACGLPVVISFTAETDGCLPNGMTLREAIETVDDATENGPAYYMINCAHPDHFQQALTEGEEWVQRIRGIQANASRRSHAELDEAEELDSGNPEEFGMLHQQLRERFPQFTILGGCCGTDLRHVEEVGKSCRHH